MDSGKIVLINLSKGKIGEDNASMIGSLLVTKFQIDAMSRADIKPEERVPFYLYIDEFQNFATDSFATILSEARKYKLSLIMANQYTSQLLETIRDAIFGNI
jgi:type IV secretory pathway TraG/TraD family ATPase VirD4